MSPNNLRNLGLHVPGPEQLNQTRELYATLQAIELTPGNTTILIKTDPKYVINGLTKT